ncbi:cytochrome P450 [Mycena polygramma]|nr:cytochrome P450 [Mycena polygramma]
MSLPTSVFAVFVGWAIVFYFVALPRRRRASMLPPGPPRDPLIGNLRHMPSEKAPLQFHKWAEIYGDVIYLEVPGQSIVVLGSLRAAEDLLDKRSLIYSDRPDFPLLEVFGWKSTFAALRYGKKLAKHRQMHQAYLNRQKCLDYMPMQLREARTLANNLLGCEPDNYDSYLSRFATGIITQITVGHEIESDEDPYLRISKMVLESLSRVGAGAGATAIDFFPFLQHFPRWFPGTYYATKSGNAKPSFVLTQLEEMDTWDRVITEDEVDLKANTASMFAAGVETTWSALSVFMLAMVLHPECQTKAQKELDRVLGAARLPEFSDRESLPYVECIFQEIFRWGPGLALGVPRRCMEDDIYRGMLIPAGSTVFANILGMTLDEKIYSHPTTFSPERYLPQPGGKGEPHFPANFGFGRRICTGQYLAGNSVWSAIATILFTCTITNAVDNEGKDIIPEMTMSYGFASHPDNFQCLVKPRTSQAETLASDTELKDH